MGEKRGTRALEAWAKHTLDGYNGVSIKNMTTSWKNGLAFCALVHKFRPHLIDFEKLDPGDVLGNCSLAFRLAERELGIPALLEAEDMAALDVPDRLSVLTYVAQFYSAFKKEKSQEETNTNRSEETRLEKNEGDESLKLETAIPSTTPESITKAERSYFTSPWEENLFLPEPSDDLISENKDLITNLENDKESLEDEEGSQMRKTPGSVRTEEYPKTPLERHEIEGSVVEDDDNSTSKAKVRFLAGMVESEGDWKSPSISLNTLNPTPILKKKKLRAPLPTTTPPTSHPHDSSPQITNSHHSYQDKNYHEIQDLCSTQQTTFKILENTENILKIELEDSYPVELNPFESEEIPSYKNPFDEDEFQGSIHSTNQTPPNPFEEDENYIQVQSIQSSLQNLFVSALPSNSSTLSLNESLGGSMKEKSRKSRRAPLPPIFISSIPLISRVKSIGEEEEIEQESKKFIPKRGGRKKRRAPPPRRRVEPLPESAIQLELTDLEVKRTELERQGRQLEKTIRELLDTESHDEEAVEEMMIQLFSIVGEKNETVRRQTELEYLTRGHRLEEKQAELEFLLRVLMESPETQREPEHMEREKQLLDELIRVVDERNEVVDWLDFHRRMDREADVLVSRSLTSFSLSTKNTTLEPPSLKSIPSDQHQKKKERKKSKEKKLSLPDVVEVSKSGETTGEKMKKEKFKIFSLRRKKKEKK